MKKTLLILCFVILSVYAVRLASSSYYYQKAIKQFSIDLERSNFLKTHDYINTSLSLYRGNAQALDLRGEVYYRQWVIEPDQLYLSKSQLLQNAKAAHLEALRYREKWPFGVLQVVRIESHEQVLSAEFYEWFDKAYKLGKYETFVALELLTLGLLRWDELSSKAKTQTIELANSSIAKRGNKLRDLKSLFKSVGLLGYMCDKTNNTKRQQILCGK